MEPEKIIKIQMELEKDDFSQKEKHKLIAALYKEQNKDDGFGLLMTATFLLPILFLLL